MKRWSSSGRRHIASRTPAKDLVDVFIVGLEPKRLYRVEVDSQEMEEDVSDPGGILYLKGLKGSTGIRFQ